MKGFETPCRERHDNDVVKLFKTEFPKLVARISTVIHLHLQGQGLLLCTKVMQFSWEKSLCCNL
jgi:hypothetical protein